jgi:CTP synthase
MCRSEKPIDEVRRKKLEIFCYVPRERIISNHDVDPVYRVPLLLEEQDLGNKILQKLNMLTKRADLGDWRNFINKIESSSEKVKVGIVGKYFDIGSFTLTDSYVTVLEAIKHAAWNNNRSPEIIWIDSKEFEKDKGKLSQLREVNGMIIPGGYGESGVEGKILAIQFARENNIPFLGLCYGLQMAVIEYARNVCGLDGAHTTEVNPNTAYPVVDLLPWQKKIIAESNMGATQRLGGQTVLIKQNTLAYRLYGKDKVIERFRHRYEINPEYIDILARNGFVFSGESEKDQGIMQIGELLNHKFFIGSQFHPEFTSRPLRPNPMFDGFIKASIS